MDYEIRCIEEESVFESYIAVAFFLYQAEDGIRDLVRSRGLGDVYKRQIPHSSVAGDLTGAAAFRVYLREQVDLHRVADAHHVVDMRDRPGIVGVIDRKRGECGIVVHEIIHLSLIHI